MAQSQRVPFGSDSQGSRQMALESASKGQDNVVPTSPASKTLVGFPTHVSAPLLEIVTTGGTPNTQIPTSTGLDGFPEILVVSSENKLKSTVLRGATQGAHPFPDKYPPIPPDTHQQHPTPDVEIVDCDPSRQPPESLSFPGPPDTGDGDKFHASFRDPVNRSAFIIKVYAILAIQLIFTECVVAFFIFNPPTKNFVQTHYWLTLPAGLFFVATYSVLIYCKTLRRTYPQNILLLVAYTLALAFFAGVLSTILQNHRGALLLLAFAITAIACILVSCIAVFSCIDISGQRKSLAVVAVVFCLIYLVTFILVKLVYMNVEIMAITFVEGFAFLYCVYLMYDTQRIMGGRHVEMSHEDYVFGAICLYTDITQLYLVLTCVFLCCCDSERIDVN